MSKSIVEVLALPDLPPAEVPIPEWETTWHVRRMSAFDAVAFSHDLQSIDADSGVALKQERLTRALCAYLCDENGNSTVTVEQARALSQRKDAAEIVNRIVEAGHKLNAVDASSAEGALKN